MWNSERFSRPKAFVGPKLVCCFQVLDRDVESERGQIRTLFPPFSLSKPGTLEQCLLEYHPPPPHTFGRISDPEQQFIGRQYCNKDKSHLVLGELLTQWNLSNCWRHRCMCRSCAEKSNLPAIGVHLVPWVGTKSSNSVQFQANFPKLTWQGFRRCNCAAQSFLVQKRSHLHPGKTRPWCIKRQITMNFGHNHLYYNSP